MTTKVDKNFYFSFEQQKLNVSTEQITLVMKPTGDAPIMKSKKILVPRTQSVASFVRFLKKTLQCQSHESLFLYLNQSFSPSPDSTIGNLYDTFGADNSLTINYCKNQAWG